MSIVKPNESRLSEPPLSKANGANGGSPKQATERQGTNQPATKPQGTLTRQDIALALYNRFGNISRREAKRLTDTVIDEMVETLTSGESLKLHDFGSFVIRSKHERAGRNPRTGEPVPIQARRVVVFKASPNMKATVNGEPSRADGDDAPVRKRRKNRRTAPEAFQTTAAVAD